MKHSDSALVTSLGLMSGTSADGVDAALVRTNGESAYEFVRALTVPYDDSLRSELIRVACEDCPLTDVLRLEKNITDYHIDACQQILQAASGDAPQVIGFHGHTIRHNAAERLTWQIGDASRLAHALACPVVSDFRRRDLAAGGHGAPLAPLFHQQRLADVERPTVVVNLGGVANITWLGPEQEILAGDVGPGCGLLDAWIQRRTGQPFDRDGAWASRGNVDYQMVEQMLRQPFFQQPIPKSADRYEFKPPEMEHLSTQDGAATLCAITVAAVNSQVDRLPAKATSIWLAGGGACHPVMVELLRSSHPRVCLIEELGLRSDSLEAECFAWLAVRHLRGLPTSLPQTTGCDHATCGGLLTQ